MSLQLWGSQFAALSGLNAVTLPNEAGYLAAGTESGLFAFTRIWVERYDTAGQLLGQREYFPEEAFSNSYVSPRMTALSSGEVVLTAVDIQGIQLSLSVTLISADGSSHPQIYMESYGITGFPATSVDTAVFEDDSFLVGWLSSTAHNGAFARFDAQGNVISEWFYEIGTATPAPLYPQVAALTRGGSAAVWSDPLSGDVHGRVFNSLNAPVGTEFAIVANASSEPVVTGLKGIDAFVVGYTSTSGIPGDSDGFGVGARIVDSGGNAGAALRLSETTLGDQKNLHIVALGPDANLVGGRFVAVWSDNSSGNFDIYARLFAGDGTALTDQILVNGPEAGDQHPARVQLLSDGRIGIYWGEVAQILDPRNGIVSGSWRNDVMLGNDITPDIMIGFGGHDHLSGLGGDDVIWGFDGDDVLIGGAGADVLLGGIGSYGRKLVTA